MLILKKLNQTRKSSRKIQIHYYAWADKIESSLCWYFRFACDKNGANSAYLQAAAELMKKHRVRSSTRKPFN